MEPKSFTNVKERLNSLVSHLHTESGILDRIVYKNKNQHRRCPYFQALLKVRRDLRLLQSADLGEILNVMFPIIEGKKPAQKAFLSKRQKKTNSSGKHNYHDRLLGAARLLSQMSEPILKAAIQISYLLAKSFFTGFSLTVLALLARLRVMVQQMLLDVVLVFNEVSSLSQKKHTVKLTQGFIEAFREYYPSGGEILRLECAWQKDKFVLLERKNVSNTENQNEDQGALPLETSIRYETIQYFSEVQSMDNEQNSEAAPKYSATEETFCVEMQPAMNSSGDQSASTSDNTRAMNCQRYSTEKPLLEGKLFASGGSVLSPTLPGYSTEICDEIAFIPMRKSKFSETEAEEPNKKMKLDLLSGLDLKADDIE